MVRMSRFPGTNIIEAVKMIGKGKEVPHCCYHPKLTIAGNCRMCMVEMGMPRDRATGEAVLEEDGTQKIADAKPTMCDERVTRHAHSHRVGDGQGVTQWCDGVSLINHPLDCPICDQAGSAAYRNFQLSMAVATVVSSKIRMLSPSAPAWAQRHAR